MEAREMRGPSEEPAAGVRGPFGWPHPKTHNLNMSSGIDENVESTYKSKRLVLSQFFFLC